MHTATQPRSARADAPSDVRVLFEAARQRRRRRWRKGGLGAAIVGLVLAAAWPSLPWSRHPRVAGGSRPAVARPPGPGHPDAGSAGVAWVDYDGRLNFENLASSGHRVLAKISAQPDAQLAAAGERIYWVMTGGTYQSVQDLDVATGKIQDLGFGQAVFAAADGTHVYITEADSISEIPAGGSGASAGPGRSLTPPAGWYLPQGDSILDPPIAVAGGFLVLSGEGQRRPAPVTLADWSPQTRRVTVIGKVMSADYGVIGAYTPPGASYGLVAWEPAACRVRCPIVITNTATQTSVTVRSPLRYGFALGGAFSPDGRWLAVFVNRTPGSGGQAANLAIASTSTGGLSLVPGARIILGEAVGWARWLPGGRQLIAGGADRSFVIDAAARSARPLTSAPAGDGPNYSAVIVSPGS